MLEQWIRPRLRALWRAFSWNVVCVASMLAALRVLNVRDVRMCLLAEFAAPFISSLSSGQVDGGFALLVAVAWRDRDSWRGALVVGALIAAKLFAMPLLLWLIGTRRFRLAALAAGSARSRVHLRIPDKRGMTTLIEHPPRGGRAWSARTLRRRSAGARAIRAPPPHGHRRPTPTPWPPISSWSRGSLC